MAMAVLPVEGWPASRTQRPKSQTRRANEKSAVVKQPEKNKKREYEKRYQI
jgi:hypothetical protein